MAHAVVVKVSAPPLSPAATCFPHTFTDRPDPSGTVSLTQLDVRASTSAFSVSAVPQPKTQNSEASHTVADRGPFAQRRQPSSPQRPRYSRIEVVIPSRRTRDPLALEVPDNQGSIRRKPSPEYGGERYGSTDAGSTDSDEECGPPAQPAKRRRVLSQPSAYYHCQPTVTASAARSSTDGPPRRMATRQGIDEEGGEGAAPGFIRPNHKEDDSEPGQDGRVASSLCMASYAPMSAEGAITLAAAVAHELYLLLIRAPATDAVVPSHRESGPPHRAGYKERLSDQGGTRARWSGVEDKRLLSLKRKNTPWEEIKKGFPCRTLGSLRQRYSTLNNRSPTSDHGRRKCGRSK
jgi:hypothetical protein